MKKRKKISLIILVGIMIILNVINVSFAEELPTEAPKETITKDILEQKMVYLKIKAEVTEGFSDSIDISYLGINGNEFTITLSKENEYTSTIPVAQDSYTLKALNANTGIDMDIAKSFSLINANVNKIYYLPVSVYQSTVQSESEVAYIHVKVSAGDYPSNLEYTGDIIINYVGTNGNTFNVSLESSTGYTKEIDIARDIYTIGEIQVEDGYVGNAMYSFDLTNASKDITYLLDISLEKKQEHINPTELEEVMISDGFQAEEETKEIDIKQNEKSVSSIQNTKNGVVHLQKIPKGFKGDLIVSYKGINGNKFAVNLSAANSYTAIVSGGVPYDIYTLEQILPTEKTNIEFLGTNLITVDETTESSFVIPIFASETTEPRSDTTVQPDLITATVLLFGFVIVIAIVVIIVIAIIKKKKEMTVLDEEEMDSLTSDISELMVDEINEK